MSFGALSFMFSAGFSGTVLDFFFFTDCYFSLDIRLWSVYVVFSQRNKLTNGGTP